MNKTIVGYMCATDYYHELGSCPCMVYPSLESVQSACACVAAKSCDAVKVEIKFLDEIAESDEAPVKYVHKPEKNLEQTIETARMCGWSEEKINRELRGK